MGRSAFEGVSDGEWAVFAEKVVAERDEARARIVELTEGSKKLCEAYQDERASSYWLHEELQRTRARLAEQTRERDEARAEVERLRQHQRECVMECAAHERDAAGARREQAEHDRDEARELLAKVFDRYACAACSHGKTTTDCPCGFHAAGAYLDRTEPK